MGKIFANVLLLAALTASATAHSWVACTDYAEENASNYDPSKCRGFPRDAATKLNVPFGTDTGYNQFTNGCGAQTRSGGIEGFYTQQFPMARWAPGQRVCMAWPAKNHVASSRSTNVFIPDNGLKLWRTQVNPTSDPANFATQGVLLHDFGRTPVGQGMNEAFPRVGFQNCPNFDSNNDKAFCSQCFNVPRDLSAGLYTIQWAWFFNSGDAQPYANCMDVMVTGNGGAPPALPSPAASPAPSRAPVNPPSPAPSRAPTPAPAPAPAPSNQPTPGGGGNGNGAAPTVSWTREWDNGSSGYGVRVTVRSSKPFSKMTVSYTLAASHTISTSWRMDRTGNSGAVTFTTPSWFSPATTFDFGMNVNYNGGRPTAPTAITVTLDGETFTVAPALSALSVGAVSTAPFGEFASSAPMAQRPGMWLATGIAAALVAGLFPSL